MTDDVIVTFKGTLLYKSTKSLPNTKDYFLNLILGLDKNNTEIIEKAIISLLNEFQNKSKLWMFRECKYSYKEIHLSAKMKYINKIETVHGKKINSRKLKFRDKLIIQAIATNRLKRNKNYIKFYQKEIIKIGE